MRRILFVVVTVSAMLAGTDARYLLLTIIALIALVLSIL